MPRDVWLAVAVHEAGHAVVGVLVGMRLGRVVLRKRRPTGFAFWEPGPWYWLDGLCYARRYLAELVAGCVAESLLLSLPVCITRPGHKYRSDAARVREVAPVVHHAQANGIHVAQAYCDLILADGKGLGPGARAEIARAEARARHILYRHRKAVRKLAETLIERRELSRPEVDRLLRSLGAFA